LLKAPGRGAMAAMATMASARGETSARWDEAAEIIIS